MSGQLQIYGEKLEKLAHDSGLDYYPVDFELVPDSFMMEVAVYGLPVRMAHWSFGVRYIHQLVQHTMGHSRLFEVVFPGNPGRAYLANNNSVEENTLVVAHVLGHADFSKNNYLFKRGQHQVGFHIVEQAAAHARQISGAIEAYGNEKVEAVLDAALALEQHIDTNYALDRPLYPAFEKAKAAPVPDNFKDRFAALGPNKRTERHDGGKRARIPPHPEYDLLWLVAHYAPEMEDWERDIFLIVRQESFYFYPVFACQIMNEGWASYWHARLLREADFLPQQLYLDAIKTHSDVVRPYAGSQQISLTVNPYHLGFSLWEKIVEEHGIAAARRIMETDDDFGFIRNNLTEKMADRLGLFQYTARKKGEIKVNEAGIEDIQDAILAPKFNFAAPRIAALDVHSDGSLLLRHEHETDGRGLDADRARKVLDYLHRVWRRPIALETIDANGKERIIEKGTH